MEPQGQRAWCVERAHRRTILVERDLDGQVHLLELRAAQLVLSVDKRAEHLLPLHECAANDPSNQYLRRQPNEPAAPDLPHARVHGEGLSGRQEAQGGRRDRELPHDEHG